MEDVVHASFKVENIEIKLEPEEFYQSDYICNDTIGRELHQEPVCTLTNQHGPSSEELSCHLQMRTEWDKNEEEFPQIQPDEHILLETHFMANEENMEVQSENINSENSTSEYENVRYNKCNQCDKSFLHKISLSRRNMLLHKGVSFKCNHCESLGERRILHWMDESNDLSETRNLYFGDDAVENDFVRDDNGEDVDNLSVSSHDTDSENSIYNEDEDFMVLGPRYLGKDKTPWNIHLPTQQRRKRRRTILTERSGVKGEAKNVTNIVEAWKIFFPDSVLQDITKQTNSRLKFMRETRKNNIHICRDTNFEEVSAVFGLLYLSGYLKSSHQNDNDLWETDGTAPPYFRLAMSYGRFVILVNAMRFDDNSTREERRKVDKLAPIRELFEGFVQRCEQSYSVGECVTIDETLEKFRGKCSFTQYIPRKVAKYGIKLFSLVDSEVYYTSKLEVYCGTQPNGPFKVDNKPAAVVNRMVQHIQGTGRNVTMDKWFSSVPLVNQLLKEKNLTVVATIKKNKREIPPQLINTRAMPPNSSLFAFRENCMLLSYIPKKYRNVIMISSMHSTDEIDDTSGDTHKPVILTYYNKTKDAVDVVDRLKSDFSVARICSRWPMKLLFTMMDIGILNAEIVLHLNTGESRKRKSLQKALALDLAKNHMISRAASMTLQSSLKYEIKQYLGLPLHETPEPGAVDNSIKCGYCPRRKNRRTQHRCARCNVPVCGEHTFRRISYCHQCEEPPANQEAE